MKDKKIDYVYDSSNKIYYYKEKIEAPSNNRLSSINDYSYNYILHNVSGKSVIEGETTDEIHIKEGLLHSTKGAAIRFSKMEGKFNGHAYYVNGELHSIRPETIPALEKNNYLIDSNFNLSVYAQNALPVYTENGNIVGKWRDEIVLKMFSTEIQRKDKFVFDNTKQIKSSNLNAIFMNNLFTLENHILDEMKKLVATEKNDELLELIKRTTKNYKLNNENGFAFEFKWNNGNVNLDIKINAIRGSLKLDKENPSIIIKNYDNKIEYYLENIKTIKEKNKETTKEEHSFTIKTFKKDILKNITYPLKNGFHVSAEAFHNDGKKSKIIYINKVNEQNFKNEVTFDKEGVLTSFTSNENLIKNYNSKGIFKYSEPKLNMIADKLKEIYNIEILAELFKNGGLYKKEWVDILEVTADIKVPEKLIISADNRLVSNQKAFFEKIELNQNPQKAVEDLKKVIRNRLQK